MLNNVLLPPLMTFEQRLLGCRVEMLSEDFRKVIETHDFRGYRMRARVLSGYGASAQSQVDIYGLNPSKISAIVRTKVAPQNNSIPMQATLYQLGEDGTETGISRGRVFYAVADFSGMPEVALRLTISHTNELATTDAKNITLTGGAALPDALAQALPDFDGKIKVLKTFKPGSTEGTIPNVSAILVQGSQLDRATQVLNSVGYSYSYDSSSQTLQCAPVAVGVAGVEESLPVKYISQLRGMIGYPTIDDRYAKVTIVADVTLSLAAPVYLDTRTQAFPDGLPFIDGGWLVGTIEHNLTSLMPGGEYTTNLVMYYATDSAKIVQRAINGDCY